MAIWKINVFAAVIVSAFVGQVNSTIDEDDDDDEDTKAEKIETVTIEEFYERALSTVKDDEVGLTEDEAVEQQKEEEKKADESLDAAVLPDKAEKKCDKGKKGDLESEKDHDLEEINIADAHLYDSYSDSPDYADSLLRNVSFPVGDVKLFEDKERRDAKIGNRESLYSDYELHMEKERSDYADQDDLKATPRKDYEKDYSTLNTAHGLGSYDDNAESSTDVDLGGIETENDYTNEDKVATTGDKHEADYDGENLDTTGDKYDDGAENVATTINNKLGTNYDAGDSESGDKSSLQREDDKEISVDSGEHATDDITDTDASSEKDLEHTKELGGAYGDESSAFEQSNQESEGVSDKEDLQAVNLGDEKEGVQGVSEDYDENQVMNMENLAEPIHTAEDRLTDDENKPVDYDGIHEKHVEQAEATQHRHDRRHKSRRKSRITDKGKTDKSKYASDQTALQYLEDKYKHHNQLIDSSISHAKDISTQLKDDTLLLDDAKLDFDTLDYNKIKKRNISKQKRKNQRRERRRKKRVQKDGVYKTMQKFKIKRMQKQEDENKM